MTDSAHAPVPHPCPGQPPQLTSGAQQSSGPFISQNWKTSFLRDRRGTVAIAAAAMAVPLLGFAGLAVDSGLAYMTKERMQRALDASALAAGKVMVQGDPNLDARRYFDLNFQPGYLGTTVSAFDAAVNQASETVTVEAEALLPTNFMKLFGIDELTISGRTTVLRTNRTAELVLVMDNTGSMRSGGKVDAMKQAAMDLMQVIYGDKQTLDNLWVSVVPYTATVNVGANRKSWLQPTDRVHADPESWGETTWKGCVEARAVPLDQDDTTPSEAAFTSFYYAADVDNEWPEIDARNEAQNNGTGPNLGCGPEITPLTADRPTVEAAIQEMLPWHRGGTLGNLGLAWGWRTISPNWRATWSGDVPEGHPVDYADPLIEKIVVIMTDGQNQVYDWPNHGPSGDGPQGSDYTAYGRLDAFGFGNKNDARREVDRRFANTCEAMKSEGVEMFTITFGSSPNSETQDLYKGCATTNKHYFHSPSNADLKTAFKSIGQELSALRIVE